MKRIIGCLVIIGIMLFTLTGCVSTKSYTFDVETGDKIEIELDTSDGYDITSNLPFLYFRMMRH